MVLIDAEKNKTFRAAKRAEADKDGKHVSYGHLAWVMAWVYRHYGDQRFRTMIDGINPKALSVRSRGPTPATIRNGRTSPRRKRSRI